MTMWQLYWLTRLDEIKAVAEVLSVIGGVAFAACFIIAIAAKAGEDEEAFGAFKQAACLSAFVLVPALIASLFLPSSKEAAFIIVAPKLYNAVSQNEALKEMPDKVVTLANEWLE